MDLLRGKRVVVGSVATGPYSNYGNRLIERAILDLLNLPDDVPRFSVFQKIDDSLLEYINSHDYVIVTGCTTLQDDPGHQACFDYRFEEIKARKVCFGGGFYCEYDETPSLRIPRMYDTPIGARDPWSAEVLAKNGIEAYLIGCPTLLDSPDLGSWKDGGEGHVLVSSSPPLTRECVERVRSEKLRLIKHDASSVGEELRDFGIFDGASLVVTGRLHAALPAIGRGVKVRFYDQRYWCGDYQGYAWGSIRYSLLRYLGVRFDGQENVAFPERAITHLKRQYAEWLGEVFHA